MTARPPHRIETERLVIRCWDLRDAALLKEAIDSSLDHLRPRMPWAEKEPEDLNAKMERLRKWISQFENGQDFFYGIFSRNETRVIGGTGLHTRRGAGTLEIGYWIRADSINHGFATECTAALTRAAFETDNIRRVEIHCDVDNVPSAAIPRKLGFTLETILKAEPMDKMVWAMTSRPVPDSD
jgi:RimJ/RimL family protein N-acetyltransferase